MAFEKSLDQLHREYLQRKSQQYSPKPDFTPPLEDRWNWYFDAWGTGEWKYIGPDR